MRGEARAAQLARQDAELRDVSVKCASAMLDLFSSHLPERRRNERAIAWSKKSRYADSTLFRRRILPFFARVLDGNLNTNATPVAYNFLVTRGINIPRGFTRISPASYLSHEFIHLGNFTNNDLVTANAVDNYLTTIRAPEPEKACCNYAAHDRLGSTRMKDVEEAFRPSKRSVKTMDAFTFLTRKPMEEIRGRKNGFPYYLLGEVFGVHAAYLEREVWKKPFYGLWLIREVGKGRKINDAIKEVQSGKFDEEIKRWSKKHAWLAQS